MKQLVVLALCAAVVWTFLKLFPSNGDEVVNAAGGGGFEQSYGDQGEAGGVVQGDPQQQTGPAQRGSTADSGEPDGLGSGLFAPREGESAGNNPFGFKPSESAASRLEPLRVRLTESLIYDRNDRARTDARNGRASLPEGVGETVMAFVDALEGRSDAARKQAGELDAAGLLSDPSREILLAALGQGELPSPALEALGDLTAEEFGMQIALWREAARLAEQQGQYRDAASYWTRVFRGVLDSEISFEPKTFEAWMEELRRVQASHRWNPNGDWPGFELTVQAGESLIAIRKRALAEREGLVLCTGLIEHANNRKSSIVHEGEKLRIPTDPVHVLVDLRGRWLLYMHGDEVVDGWQVGIGRPGEETITGQFWVGNKQKDPTHFARGKEPVPFGTKANPLGTRWMGWRMSPEAKDSSYGFHGTWEEHSIGAALGEGCIRMVNDRVEFLFEVLPQQAQLEVREGTLQ